MNIKKQDSPPLSKSQFNTSLGNLDSPNNNSLSNSTNFLMSPDKNSNIGKQHSISKFQPSQFALEKPARKRDSGQSKNENDRFTSRITFQEENMVEDNFNNDDYDSIGFE